MKKIIYVNLKGKTISTRNWHLTEPIPQAGTEVVFTGDTDAVWTVHKVRYDFNSKVIFITIK